MTFTLKKRYILGLVTWLSSLSLDGKTSRMRSRFCRKLREEFNRMEEDRKKIAEKYVKKDKKGNAKTVKNARGYLQWDIDPSKKEKFTKEVTDLFDSDAKIKIANEKEFAVVRSIVLDTTEKFGPEKGDPEQVRLLKAKQANDYDEWCEAFEKSSKKN